MLADDAAGRRLYEACFAAGIVNDLRHWDERRGERDGWTWRMPALDEPTKAKWRQAARNLENPVP